MKTYEVKRTNFIVDRSKWRCGSENDSHDIDVRCHSGRGGMRLWNNEGYKCCLGFIAEQLGIDVFKIREHGYPCVESFGPLLHDGSKLNGMTDFARRAVEINDDDEGTLRTVEEKEKALQDLAEEYGLRIEFVGDYSC